MALTVSIRRRVWRVGPVWPRIAGVQGRTLQGLRVIANPPLRARDDKKLKNCVFDYAFSTQKLYPKPTRMVWKVGCRSTTAPLDIELGDGQAAPAAHDAE
jgi:hypothetical protein